MTTTTLKTNAKPRQLPWLKYSSEVDAQIARHTTPAQIEAAYQTYIAQTPGERIAARTQAQPKPATVTVVNGASEKQAILIDKLLVEKEHIIFTEEFITEVKADWRKTRKLIDLLIAAPRKPYQAPIKVEVLVEVPTDAPARLDFDAIPDGYYALNAAGVVKFYRVSTSKKGYKNVQSQASDTLYPLFGKAGIAVLHRLVEAGLEAAQALYATELGRCWTCGRTLTDEESRAAGQGPICRGK